jgi:hypothetical protein
MMRLHCTCTIQQQDRRCPVGARRGNHMVGAECDVDEEVDPGAAHQDQDPYSGWPKDAERFSGTNVFVVVTRGWHPQQGKINLTVGNQNFELRDSELEALGKFLARCVRKS